MVLCILMPLFQGSFVQIAAIKFVLPFRSKAGTTLSQKDKYDMVFVVSLGMVHIGLEQTHGSSILLPHSQQQRFRISLSRMRYGEGMVVVKEVMEAMIWFHEPTNLSLSHLCTASSLCEKTRR
ncbi:unnamed protein product [Brassica napus]|uniref:(rape) hypothetical protein n=1 Tax=Brassica napus TaxID=3708 RepID=A0A816ZH76_BRANA|nr:unnamed protein product [Brassica napus]CAF2280030.1 unnamed protein product [Brassica napus]